MYEHLVTRLLSAGSDATEAVSLEPLKVEHLAELLAKHVAAEVRRMFASAPASTHLELGLELSERVFPRECLRAAPVRSRARWCYEPAMKRGLAAAVVALGGCDSAAPAKPCKRGATLEVAVVDDGAAYTKSLYRRVGSDRDDAPTDPAAIAAGVRADIDMWKRDILNESGLPIQPDTHTDYYLRARDRATLETYLADAPPPADRALRYEEVQPFDDGGPGDHAPYVRTYLVVMPPFLDTTAVARVEEDTSGSDVPLIRVTLTDDGKRVFTAATTAAVRKKVAVMVDGTVVSAPVINEPVPAGRFSMTMPSKAQMKDVLAKLACVK